MSRRLFLHVGLPKSGTTYVQAVLGENKARLKERAAVLYPGRTWAAQVLAARDVLDANPSGFRNPEVDGAWQRLLDEVRAWHGDSVVSMEWLGSARAEHAQLIADTAKPARVEVIVTIRDLARTIPAAWQELMQNYDTWSWSEFLRSVSSDTPRGTPAGDLFWRQQDIGRLLTIWRDAVPADQIHVVTIPPRGATAAELWMRFSRVLGVDGAQFDASGKGSNESLGWQSAEFMRRLNLVSKTKGLDWPTYDEMFKHALAKRGLAKRKDLEDSLLLPTEFQEWARARTAETVTAIKAAGVHVVGDLADLDPVFGPEPVSAPEAKAEELLEVALEGLVALARDRERELSRLRKRRTDLLAEQRRLHRQLKVVRGLQWVTGSDWRPSLRESLVSASEDKPWLMRARRRYRATRNAVQGRLNR